MAQITHKIVSTGGRVTRIEDNWRINTYIPAGEVLAYVESKATAIRMLNNDYSSNCLIIQEV